jgi:hypothetical protein
MTGSLTTRTRAPAAALVGWLSAVAAIGTTLLAVGHAGVQIPLLSALGPGGNRAVPIAAAAFTLATALYAAVAAGAFSGARWAWPLGLVVHGLAVLGGLGNYRGAASAFGIALGVACLVVLLSPGGRRALRG